MRARDYGFSGDYGMKRIDTAHWFGLRIFPKDLFLFTDNPADPLTYRAFDSTLYRPGATLETDKGSIPPFLRIFIRPSAYERAYIMHDYGYRHGGFLVQKIGENPGFVFVRMSRQEIDLLLREMILNSGGSRTKASAVYAGVKIGSGPAWRRHRAAEITE